MFAAGRSHIAIPGPSVMPDAVLAAMQRPAPDIYDPALEEMVAGIAGDLRWLAGTRHDVAIYIANGHAIWEAALSNILGRGDLALVLATGRFGHGWADMAAGLGIKVEVMDFGSRDPVDPARLESRLRADRAGRIRAVLVCQTDTASGVLSDVAAIRVAMEAAGHGALLAVDGIAAMGCDRFEMDAWGVDLALSASQKGLMTPPGLGFVWFGPRAAAARARLGTVSRYWDWAPRARPTAFWEYFDGTAPTHHLFGLRAALDLMRAEGREAIWRRHETLARAIWAAFGRWSGAGPLRIDVPDHGARSHAVTAVHAGAGNGLRLRDWTREVAGLTLGVGLGREPQDDWFRIGHMGHVNAQMVLGTLATIEAGLQALGIAHGAGAVEAAAGEIARASRPA